MNYNEYFETYIESSFYKKEVAKYPQLVEIIEKGENPTEIVEEMFARRNSLCTTLPPFFNVKTIEYTQFFSLALRGCGDWTVMEKIVMEIAKETECLIFETYSDMGSTKVGNNDFTICINNGVGDGATITIIDEREEFPRDLFKFFTRIEGKFNVFEYDCGEKKVINPETHKPLVLNGAYLTYGDNGFVLIQKLK